jgi:multidrug resistance efflux pump
MKSIDFKRKGSAIRVLSEDTKKIKYNWDRVIYIVFLTGVLLFLGYYFTNKILFIKANGQVLFENVIVRLTDDCRVLWYNKKEDDIVKKGDSLFTYTLDKDNIWGNYSLPGNVIKTTVVPAWEWMDKEKFQLQEQIELNNIEIAKNKTLIKAFEKELQQLKNEVILDVLPHDRLQYVQNQILTLETDIKKLNSENTEYNQLIAKLDAIPRQPPKPINSGGMGSVNNNLADSIRVFYSPFDGTVTRIYTQQFEVALKSDQIMAIHKNNPMYIKGYFNQEDLNFFKEGDQVDIQFPDGSKSKALIRRFYYTTYQMPEEFQKRYEPTTRTIAADIYPVDTAEYVHWRAFYRLGVTITKFKY